MSRYYRRRRRRHYVRVSHRSYLIRRLFSMQRQSRRIVNYIQRRYNRRK